METKRAIIDGYKKLRQEHDLEKEPVMTRPLQNNPRIQLTIHRDFTEGKLAAIRTSLQEVDGEFASMKYSFRYQPNNIVRVSPSIKTEQGNEGQGFASGLFGLTNQVIQDAVDFLPELDKKIVVSVIDDDARNGVGSMDRTGWTSRRAEELGYEPLLRGFEDGDRPQWQKIYRKSFLNRIIHSLKK